MVAVAMSEPEQPSDHSLPAAALVASCAQCAGPLGVDAVTLTDRSLCRGCYDVLAETVTNAVRASSTNVNYPMAVVGAVAGGVVGAVAWWAFTITTNINFGLVAVVIGYLAGQGAMRFAGNKRTTELQWLSAIVAALSYGLATYMVNLTLINRHLQSRGEGLQVPLVPVSVAQVWEILQIGFSAMDLAFLGITVWQAWKITQPLQLPGERA